MFLYPLLEINNHKNQKILLGHPVTLPWAITWNISINLSFMNVWMVDPFANAIMNRFWRDLKHFLRVIILQRLPAALFLIFVSFFSQKAKNMHLDIKNEFFYVILYIFAIYDKMRQKSKKAPRASAVEWFPEENASSPVKIGSLLRSQMGPPFKHYYYAHFWAKKIHKGQGQGRNFIFIFFIKLSLEDINWHQFSCYLPKNFNF